MNTRFLFTHALSPLHAGTGQGVGVIDLPIAREKATNLPYLPGSSVKGVLRDACENGNKVKIFGPDGDKASEHAGSVQISDQRLLLLPVRSIAGTFAWVTCPLIVQRLIRDAEFVIGSGIPSEKLLTPGSAENCFISEGTTALKSGNDIYLEDLDLKPNSHASVTKWAEWIGKQIFPDDSGWRNLLTQRFCLVHDDVMSFLLETATEVVARIKLDDERKTVAKGALWYEESLPTETVLSGLVVVSPTKQIEKDLKAEGVLAELERLTSKPMQFGGKSTVGRGMCRLRLQKGV